MTNGCCFNYWTEDASAPHGVKNRTVATPLDDSLCACTPCWLICVPDLTLTSLGCGVMVRPDLADSFTRFIESRKGEPFLAQISFHNCHVRDRAIPKN